MKRSRNFGKVSLASGSNLRQEKLFLSPSTDNEFDYLPPDVEWNHLKNKSKTNFPSTPEIKWKCPPLFALRDKWQVAEGKESKEKQIQELRETEVKEVVYPCIYAIPQRPTSPIMEMEYYDDTLTPLIPTEEEEEYSFANMNAIAKEVKSTTLEALNDVNHDYANNPISKHDDIFTQQDSVLCIGKNNFKDLKRSRFDNNIKQRAEVKFKTEIVES